MFLSRIQLQNVRNYESLELQFPSSGVIVLQGENGQGKTNLLESIAYLPGMESFRFAQPDTLIQLGHESAVLRAEGYRRERELLVELQWFADGRRKRMMLNRQNLQSTVGLSEGFLAVVFSPDDLQLVKGGPVLRRAYLDELLRFTSPSYNQVFVEFQRVLRQRNTLLRQAGGRLSTEVELTLDVWDERFSSASELMSDERELATKELSQYVDEATRELSRGRQGAEVSLLASWRQSQGGQGMEKTLRLRRETDLLRGVSTVGPHRDDLFLGRNGQASRTHASQGEQRTLALGLKLGAFRRISDATGSRPLLLLDDVFSELDETRAACLVKYLPGGQTFITTAGDLPPGVDVAERFEVRAGMVKQ